MSPEVEWGEVEPKGGSMAARAIEAPPAAGTSVGSGATTDQPAAVVESPLEQDTSVGSWSTTDQPGGVRVPPPVMKAPGFKSSEIERHWPPVTVHNEIPPVVAILPKLALLSWFAIMVLAGIGLLVMMVRRGRRRAGQESPDEIRLMQEIHQGLSGLERRVESLETILLDRVMAREGEGWKSR